MTRRRLDAELVRRGITPTLAEAELAVASGIVLVGGRPAVKPSTLVDPAAPVEIARPADRFVSRGGTKLDAALERFSVEVAGRGALDVGASTGGFTDCLLDRGAARVVAVDVGYGQLDWSLRNDPRVLVLERTNVRDLRADTLPFAPEIVAADLSFISLRLVIPVFAELSADEADLVLLVKPQFEARREEVEAGGVVRDPDVWSRTIGEVVDACAHEGLTPVGVMASPIAGPAGNVEFLLHAAKGGPQGSPDVPGAIAEGREVAAGRATITTGRVGDGPTGRRDAMKAAGFVVHPGRTAAARAAESLAAWLQEHDVETRTLHGTHADAGTEAEIEAEARSFATGLDLIVSVGGDGTFLRAARLASLSGVPVLGVKVGRMGFLTEVEPEEAPAVLAHMLDATARIEERIAVSAEGASFAPQWALNEVIVEKSARHRLIRLAVFVDDAYVTTFSADGVISATPTGSTAYSFSAGGPIVSPSVPCLVVTPIAAHMVFDRSLVLGAEQRVRLEVLGEEPGLLSADGRQSLELPVGTAVEIRRAEQPARLVRREDALAFHELVRDKFELPGDVGGPG